jgi:PIN domain nuclease of toxin-antitoxin system
MSMLLDTNVFIWLNDSPQQIPQQIITLLADPDNDLFFSLVSAWEMQIKIQLGKLNLQDSLPKILMTQQSENNLQILPIQLEHIWALEGLPNHHRDPFDRCNYSGLLKNAVSARALRGLKRLKSVVGGGERREGLPPPPPPPTTQAE